MDKRPRHTNYSPSYLFTVRIWREKAKDNDKEWRGQVEQVLGGRCGYFREWPTLITFLEETLAELEPDAFPIQGKEVSGPDVEVD